MITVGAATLAAFVGAGGLGEPIVTGLALVEGAVPPAHLRRRRRARTDGR